MTRRTKLIAALSAVALLAVMAFLLGPALFPRLDPSEDISKDSDAKIRAQDSSSGGSLAKCTYSSESGTVRTVYSDGRELYKFQSGHLLEIDPPREAGDRVAVATFDDGAIRREIFEYDTTVVQMIYRIPRAVEWFKPDGSPRTKPDPGQYPELWDKVAEFTSSAGDIGPEHPWGEEWEQIEPPGGNPGDAEIFGPVRRVVPGDGVVWTWFADRTVKEGRGQHAIYRNRGLSIAYFDFGRGRAYVYEGEDEGYPSMCPDQREAVVKSIKIKYGDGVTRRFYVDASVDLKQLSSARRFCETWERDGQKIEPLGGEDYPVFDLPAEFTGSPPPELFQ